MKHFLTPIALACATAVASAGTTVTTPAPPTVTLKRGTTNVDSTLKATSECVPRAQADAASAGRQFGIAVGYTCNTSSAFKVTYQMEPDTRHVACMDPKIGPGYDQTQTYKWSPAGSSSGGWVGSGWLPAAEPTGVCVTPPPPPPPPTEVVSTWATIAREVDPFKAFTANGVVRYGHPSQPNNWVSKTFSGPSQCIGSVFTTIDPAPGLYKECQVLLSAPNVVQTGAMPVINVPLLPPAQKGYSIEMISNGGGFQAGPYDIGAFRTNCGVSHFAFDDPIVFPGQPGKSHLHMFFGNTGANANSTPTSIANSGDSTCSGGILNRTGYWVPAMVNLKTGAPVVPSGSIWYYKGGYGGIPSENIKPFPAGLRMIAGESGRTTPRTDDMIRFGCASTGIVTRSIPNCAVGDQVTIGIVFPQCWDGVNLDSPDHKSHMAYPTGTGCPSTHPVGLPDISLNVAFTVTEARPDLNWKLSSDNYVGPGGYAMHADWWDGWRDDIMKTWVVNCINKRASSSNAICDGRTLTD